MILKNWKTISDDDIKKHFLKKTLKYNISLSEFKEVLILNLT